MKYLVKLTNGCGDHIAWLIEADSPAAAVRKAECTGEWDSTWELSVTQHVEKPHSIFYERPWLIDFEEYFHEEPYYTPRF